MSGLNLNGSTALAESIKQQLSNVRRDWRVEAAQMRERITQGLLDLERTMSAARELLANVTDGAPGRDGKDGTNGKDGAPGRDGVDGKPGRDGQDGAPGQPGQPGAPGERGEPGPKGVFAAPLPFKAGQITYGGGLVYHEGSTFCALRDTAATPPHADFQPVAYRGRDGKDAYAGRARGLYDGTRDDYRAMDTVTHNNSEWRATRDKPGPLPGDSGGWVLSAKGAKGKTGDQGPRGEAGERGPAGPPGLGLAAVELQGVRLVFTRTDGSVLHVDLESLIG